MSNERCIYCADPIEDGVFRCPTCKRPCHRDCLNPHIEYWEGDETDHLEMGAE